MSTTKPALTDHGRVVVTLDEAWLEYGHTIECQSGLLRRTPGYELVVKTTNSQVLPLEYDVYITGGTTTGGALGRYGSCLEASIDTLAAAEYKLVLVKYPTVPRVTHVALDSLLLTSPTPVVL
jgi:hypothetical protein